MATAAAAAAWRAALGIRSKPNISYENYNATGRTPVGDLQTLCRHCHQIITGRTFHRTFGQWLGQFWRPLTLRQKVKVIINVTIIAVVVIWLLFGAPIPRRPVPAATPDYGYGPPAYGSSTLIIPPIVARFRDASGRPTLFRHPASSSTGTAFPHEGGAMACSKFFNWR